VTAPPYRLVVLGSDDDWLAAVVQRLERALIDVVERSTRSQ
jgi:hypothetical protein